MKMANVTGYRYSQVEDESTFPVGWVVLTLALVTLVIVLAYFYARQRFQLIEPTRCPTVEGTFALKAGTTGEVLKQCGTQSNEDCSIEVNTLEEAVLQCNQRKDICNVFTYDEGTSTMKIINSSQSYSPTNTENMYLRQT